eukprot:3598625-Heterocapsa_arctica.AAC.1
MGTEPPMYHVATRDLSGAPTVGLPWVEKGPLRTRYATRHLPSGARAPLYRAHFFFRHMIKKPSN